MAAIFKWQHLKLRLVSRCYCGTGFSQNFLRKAIFAQTRKFFYIESNHTLLPHAYCRVALWWSEIRWESVDVDKDDVEYS